MLDRAQCLNVLLYVTSLQAAFTSSLGCLFADPLLQVAPFEQERVAPSLKGELPPFAPKAGARRFAIFNHLGRAQSPHVVYMYVPQEFTGADTTDPTRVWGLNLLVHYPDMAGPGNPHYAGKLGVCAGGCPGEMLISIYNYVGRSQYGAEAWEALLDKDMHNPVYSSAVFTNMSSEAFTRVTREEWGSDPKNPQDKIYFEKRDSRGSIEFFARCSYNTPVHLCQAFTSLASVDGVEIQYTLHLENIAEWPEIQKTVLSFVDTLIGGIYDVADSPN